MDGQTIGTIIGVVVTIIIAAVSSRSGKVKVEKNLPPKQNDDFLEQWRQLLDGSHATENRSSEVDSLQETVSAEQTPLIVETLERPVFYEPLKIESLEKLSSEDNLILASDKIVSVRAVSEIEATDNSLETDCKVQRTDFNLRDAVIYSEIIKPRYF